MDSAFKSLDYNNDVYFVPKVLFTLWDREEDRIEIESLLNDINLKLENCSFL